MNQARLPLTEDFIGLGVGGVDHRAGGKDEGDGIKRVVGVLGDPAAHPATVVGQDAAHHAGVDGSRIRAHLRAEGLEGLIHVAADHPGLHADFPTPILDPHRAPVSGHLDQNAVGDGLTGQARPGRAEGHRHPVRPAEPEEALNLLDTLGQNHRLRDQAIEARISRVGDPLDRPGEHPLPLDDLRERIPQRMRNVRYRRRDRSVGHALASIGLHLPSSPYAAWYTCTFSDGMTNRTAPVGRGSALSAITTI